MEAFGALAMVLAIIALEKIRKLERRLRESGIGSAGGRDLGQQLAKMIGQSVTLSLDDDTMGYYKPCRVLDADELWALLLVDEGKKKERQMLIRLEDVREIKVKK